MADFKTSKDRITILLGGNIAGCTYIETLCDLAQEDTPGLSSISISTHFQNINGAIIRDEWPSSSLRYPPELL